VASAPAPVAVAADLAAAQITVRPDAPAVQAADAIALPIAWAPDAEQELRKIPFFVRGKARRNTERYAEQQRVPVITIETLYDAKAHFSR
jgi:light-independent protochlorophyllide reductase subunit B